MRLTGIEVDGRICVGYVRSGSVTSLGALDEFWRDPDTACRRVTGGRTYRLDEIRLVPALPSTAKIICIGVNYKAHAEESGAELPKVPVVFARWRETLIADGEPSPAMDPYYDWEAELGVVIGKGGLAIPDTKAFDHVFGYCTFNDLSARSLQMESSQWALGKNSDRSGPIGLIVSADEAGNPADGWRVTTRVNGVLMQDGITSDLIFTVPELIAFVSRSMTLLPGDLIITGTPSGIGLSQQPPVVLKPGDKVVVEVGSLGTVTTPIVAPPQTFDRVDPITTATHSA